MKTPPLLLGASLLLWGWQAELFIWGLLMAVLVEASNLVARRWEMAEKDLNRIWDLCIVLDLGAALIAYSSQDSVHRALAFFQWQPIVFLPILLAKLYGTIEKIPLRVFSWILRRVPNSAMAGKVLDISYIYFGVCLLATAASNRQSVFFYPGIVLLIVIALALTRPKRMRLIPWLILIGAIGFAGDFTHRQIRALQPRIESNLGYLLYRLFRREPDARESRTAMGQIGQVKLSSKIVLRVQTESNSPPPALLRQASYDWFERDLWRASSAAFNPVIVDQNDIATLLPRKTNSVVARVSMYLNGGRGLLLIPNGTFEIGDIPVVLETNRFGVCRADSGPGLVTLIARYGPGATFDSSPSPMDTNVPAIETEVLEKTATELGLRGKTEAERIKAISKFFGDHFRYTTYLSKQHVDRTGKKTPVGQFLTTARSGHCEYFAAATVLLLRQSGIPARYATGYSVQETALRGNTFIVRERHAHAWALVWRSEKACWEDLDTTPGSWDAIETQQASEMEWLSDLWADLVFQISKWRWSKTSYAMYLRWALVPLVLLLAWRIFFVKRRHRLRSGAGERESRKTWPGMDSELYRIERELTAIGMGRASDQPSIHWQRQLEACLPAEAGRIERIFDLHRRLRFDPKGLSVIDRELLASEAVKWLEAFRKSRLPK